MRFFLSTALTSLFLLLGSGCDNDNDEVLDVINLENLTDTQIVDGTLYGLRTNGLSNVKLTQSLIDDADIFEQLSHLPGFSDTNSEAFSSPVLSYILTSTGIDLNLTRLMPELVDAIIANSIITARSNNRFTLDPDENEICTHLATNEAEQTKCKRLLADIQIDAIVTQQKDDLITAADVEITIAGEPLLPISFSPNSATFDFLLPGIQALLVKTAEIDSPGEPVDIPSTMSGNIRLSVEQSSVDFSATVSLPQRVEIADRGLTLPVSIIFEAADQLARFSLNSNTREVSMQLSTTGFEILGFDVDENGAFPVKIISRGGITGNVLIQDLGRQVRLSDIGINNLELNINNEPAINLSLDDFSATIEDNRQQPTTLTFNSAFRFGLFAQNRRGYFSDLFDGLNNPDLRREVSVNIDTGTQIKQLSETLIKLENGAIFAGLSIDNQDPLAIEISDGTCFDTKNLEVVNCPIFSVRE